MAWHIYWPFALKYKMEYNCMIVERDEVFFFFFVGGEVSICILIEQR